MCGICGYYNDGGPALLAEMCEIMSHRGPDDRGTFADGPVGLGMTRLAIIDPATGHQPIANEDRAVTVVFNGEIYNYRELRAALVQKGHRFRTGADTETLVHLFEDLRFDCVEKLRGVFAFAIWDGDTLFIARDRLGVKPLYYTWVKDRFYFASEIKALLLCPGVGRDVDLEALDDFLTLQYVPAPRTLFRGIYKLPAAHWLKVNRNGAWVYRYWDLPDGASADRLSARRAKERTASLLAEAVSGRTVADVPVGALLSGGLDSSLVVALVRRLGGPAQTFHIKFAGEEGEAAYARQVAASLSCDHHELEATPEDLALLPKVIWHLDEPIADAAAWATYLICRYAKQHVTVLLTGEGGDELFGGYPRYLLSRVADAYQRFPAVMRSLVGAGVGAMAGRRPASPLWRYAAKVAAAPASPCERNFLWLSIFSTAERRAFYKDDLYHEISFERARKQYGAYFRGGEGRSTLQRLIAADIKTWLADDVLMKVDKASMAAGIEARVPLLDHVLAEFAVALADRARVGWGAPKKLLKEVAKGLLPPAVVRRPKRAFVVPVDKWLRKYERSWVHDALTDPNGLARTYFKTDAIAQLLDDYFATGAGARKVWNLFCLELWREQFLNGGAPRRQEVERQSCVISS